MLLLMLPLLPFLAQAQADTTFVFRFTAGKDMFYVPYNGNDKELARLEACVEQHKDAILTGNIPLHVDGYCSSAPTEREKLAIAKIRSNRVKSELITRSGLKENCFVTRNHVTDGDFVTVRLVVPPITSVKPKLRNRLLKNAPSKPALKPNGKPSRNVPPKSGRNRNGWRQRNKLACKPKPNRALPQANGRQRYGSWASPENSRSSRASSPLPTATRNP